MAGIAQRWAVRNVAKATFLDTEDKMLTFLESLKSSGIEVTSETVYARGGDGNPKLVGFSSDKEARVNLSSAIFDNRAMALLTGNKIVTGAEDIYRREVITVDSSHKASVVGTPKGDPLAVFVMGEDGVEGVELEKAVSASTGKYAIAAKQITVHTDIDEGKQLVVYYMYTTSGTAQTITVSSDKFPAAFKLVLEVLVTDLYTKNLYPAQIVIPSARMEDNWSLSFEPTGRELPPNMVTC